MKTIRPIDAQSIRKPDSLTNISGDPRSSFASHQFMERYIVPVFRTLAHRPPPSRPLFERQRLRMKGAAFYKYFLIGFLHFASDLVYTLYVGDTSESLIKIRR